MAKTTIAGYSNELNQGPPGNPQTYQPIPVNKYMGRVRMSSFTLTFAAQVSGTSLAVAQIPKGSRIISGVIVASATLANSATLSVGLAGADGTGNIDDAKWPNDSEDLNAPVDPTGAPVVVGTPISDAVACLKAAAAQGSTQIGFALTQALGYLYETQKLCYLTITTGTGTVSTEFVSGHVFYTTD